MSRSLQIRLAELAVPGNGLLHGCGAIPPYGVVRAFAVQLAAL